METDTTVADTIAQACASHGVKRAFGVPGGGSSLDMIEALGRHGIGFQLCSTETGAVLMAAADAELRGAFGVAIVTQGPVIDLNVMTRRTCYRHHVCRETGSGGRASIVAADVMLVVALGDGLRAGGTPLGRHDCLVLAAGDTPDLTTDTGMASSEGAMVSIELWRLR